MQTLSSAYTGFVNYMWPAPLKIGYANEQAYKPRIVVTGEKANLFVLSALKKYTDQQSTYVSLTDLKVRSKDYDLNRDLLLLIIPKDSGDCPLRGFDDLDGPLRQYRDTIFNFSKHAALVIPDSTERLSIAEIQRQANLQIPENLKNQVIATSNLWSIANQVQALFKS